MKAAWEKVTPRIIVRSAVLVGAARVCDYSDKEIEDDGSEACVPCRIAFVTKKSSK